MKRIHVFIIRSFIGPLILTFFIALFILLMQYLWKYIDEWVGKGLEWYIIAEMLLYASANLVPMALLLGVLLASIMTFGNLGENFELVALKSSGISLQRIMLPLFIFVLILSYGSYLFNNHVLPHTNLKMRVMRHSILETNPEINIVPGIFNNRIEGISIKVGSKNKETKMLYDILIYDHRDYMGNRSVIISDSGYMENIANRYMVLTLYNGYSYEELMEQRGRSPNRTYPHQRTMFDKNQIMLGMEDFGFKKVDEGLFKGGYDMLSRKQLLHALDSLEKSYNRRKAEYSRTHFSSNYLKKEPRNKAQNKYKYMSFEHYFNNLTVKEKNQVINHAGKSLRKRKQALKMNTPGTNMKKAVHTDTTHDSVEADTIYAFIPEIETGQEKIKMDTIKKQWVDYDSLFICFTPREKLKTVNMALNFVRTSKNMLESTQLEFDSKASYIARHEIALFQKFTLSAACIIFFFIGAPMGAIIRKGGLGLPVVVSVVFFIFYYVITMIGERYAKTGKVEPVYGVWVPNLILLPIGIWLIYKATTDSPIMDMETYTNFFKKIFPGKRKYTVPADKFSRYLSASQLKEEINTIQALEHIILDMDLHIQKIGRMPLLQRIFLKYRRMDKARMKTVMRNYNSAFYHIAISQKHNKYMLSFLEDLPELSYKKLKRYGRRLQRLNMLQSKITSILSIAETPEFFEKQ